MMESTPDRKDGAQPAPHGTPTEVSWDQGEGRQPYANRKETAVDGVAAGSHFAEGDRSELSGRNQDQLEQVKQKP